MRTNNIIFRNSAFLWIAFAVGLILLIPLIAMQFTSEVDWDVSDFIVMGILLFSVGTLFIFLTRKLSHRWRIVVGIIFVAAFLFVWAELAVGVFTNIGS